LNIKNMSYQRLLHKRQGLISLKNVKRLSRVDLSQPRAYQRGSQQSRSAAGLAGRRSCLLVTFPEAESLGLVQRMRQLLGAQLRGVIDSIAPNPDVQWLAPLYEQVQRDHAEVPVIVALGGGSAIDSAKALICHTPGGRFADLLALLKQGGQLGREGTRP
jgi:alcohol dehydrogenase class IV